MTTMIEGGAMQKKAAPDWLIRLSHLVHDLNEMSTFDLCSIVTLVLLFLYAGTTWYLTIPMNSVTLCAIFLPRLRSSPKLWFVITMLMVSANTYDRIIIDNHKYLMTYWCLTFFLASLQSDAAERDRVLAFNARILLGLCFFIAVIAKLISPDYLSGGFFHHTLLMDDRFTNFTWLAGAVPQSTLSEMKSILDDLQTGYLLNVDAHQMHLINAPRLSLVVGFMTWWTVCIESSIALVFLAPFKNQFFEWGRRYLLWIFLCSTYAVALVSGFAWLLATMGLAQLPRNHGKYRIIYILIMAVALQFYEVRYVSLTRDFFDFLLPNKP